MADVTSPPMPARPPMSFGAWLGVVLLFLFFGIFVLVLVAATPHGNNYEQKRAKAREEKLKTIRDTATKELNSYAWVDKSKGVARIPIDRAMEFTIRDLASKKPAPANPIAPPAEAAAPATSPPAPAVSPAGMTPGASASPPSGQHAVSPSTMPQPNPPGTSAPPPAKSPP